VTIGGVTGVDPLHAAALMVAAINALCTKPLIY